MAYPAHPYDWYLHIAQTDETLFATVIDILEGDTDDGR